MDLDDFIRSEHFQDWRSDNESAGGCGIILSDPERYDRIVTAAENGCDGSTHGEHIQDWRDALECADLADDDRLAIEAGILKCEAYHEEHGTLDVAVN